MRTCKNCNKGRQASVLTLNLPIYHISAVLALALLIFSPTFYSCTKIPSHTSGTSTGGQEETVIQRIELKSDYEIESHLDVFFFDADRLRRLDSFQRFEGDNLKAIEAASREGNKIIAVIANSGLTIEECGRIRTYSDLNLLYCNLTSDSPTHPVMYAESEVRSGHNHLCNITLEPLMAKITINTISCDFHSRPYAREKLKNLKMYLTNVCSRYPIGGSEPDVPDEIINYGRLRQEDIEKFDNSDLLLCDTGLSIGENVVQLNTDLYCYQNTAVTESLGTPFTRLVIEGELRGEKTYYPIEINRGTWQTESDSTGVWRNTNYCYDLTLTRRGVSDPDIPITPVEINCTLTVKPWNEKAGRTVTF